MKLKQIIILVLTVVSSLGWADQRPPPFEPTRPDPIPGHRPPPPEPRPNPRPDPYPQPNPEPVRPRPEPPVRPNPGDHSQVLSIPIHRYVTNERLSISGLLNLDPYYRYEVEAVIVDVRNSYNSSLQLVVNGIVEDSVYAPTQLVTLYPRQLIDLNDPSLQMDLLVDGQSYISTISVRIRDSNDNSDADQIRLPVLAGIDLYDGQTVDLLQSVDAYAYQGYRIIGIEISADAYYSTATLQLLADQYSVGDAVISGGPQTVTIYPRQELVMGQSFSSLMLTTSGSGVVNFGEVTLRLARY